jgi:hypothetical protein
MALLVVRAIDVSLQEDSVAHRDPNVPIDEHPPWRLVHDAFS